MSQAIDVAPRVVVFAYSETGHACLELLLRRGCRVVAVFTHEDNPGENRWFRSVADLATAAGVPVYKPDSVKESPWPERLAALEPDLIFSFYYRHMIPEALLKLAPLGAFNMHGSLLPRYRGRAPVNWAVLHGESETGATLHHMVRRADAGDIVDQQAVPINPDETAAEVGEKVVHAAVVVLERQLDALSRGIAPRHPQDESQATYFGGRKPEDGRIDWTQSARSIHNLVRAVTHPFPGAFTTCSGGRLMVWKGGVEKDIGKYAPEIPSGRVLQTLPLCVQTGDGIYRIDEIGWADDSLGPVVLRPGDQLG